MQKIIIINDHQTENDLILYLLSSFLSEKEIYHNIEEFNDHYSFSNYDIFVIDIHIDDGKGIALAKYIKEKNDTVQIIFMGSSLENISDIYEVEHCYFMASNSLEKYLLKAIQKAMQNIESDSRYLFVQTKSKKITVKTKDIVFLERSQRYTYIHTVNQSIRVAKSLDEIMIKVPRFLIRLHNSYAVNINNITEMKRENVLLNNGQVIPISRKYQKKAKELLYNYIKEKQI